MTPNDIEVLLHCHVSPTPHPRLEYPGVSESLRMLKGAGLITQTDGMYNTYETTPRGRAHVEQLCNLELPRLQWVSRDGVVLDQGS